MTTAIICLFLAPILLLIGLIFTIIDLRKSILAQDKLIKLLAASKETIEKLDKETFEFGKVIILLVFIRNNLTIDEQLRIERGLLQQKTGQRNYINKILNLAKNYATFNLN